jgi:hypothetical protein
MKQVQKLIFEGEIRFGPCYCKLELNGQKVSGIFGENFTRSPDLRYMAFQEWLTTDYQEGPITRVAIFDLETQKVAYLKTVNKGFVENFQFKDGLFIYDKRLIAENMTKTVEVTLCDICNWELY